MTTNGIHTLRKQLDGLRKTIEDSDLSSRPVSLSITQIEQSRMWLGESLKELGAVSPYKNSFDASNDKIDPAGDTADGNNLPEEGYESETKFVKQLRVTISEQIERIRREVESSTSSKKFYKVSMLQAYVALNNANMYLGAELNLIYESNK